MTKTDDEALPQAIVKALEPDEQVKAYLPTAEAVVAVTDRRLIVVSDERMVIALDVRRLRRIELTIEKGRSGTLTVVPEWPTDPPQFLVIEPDQFGNVCELIGALGPRLST